MRTKTDRLAIALLIVFVSALKVDAQWTQTPGPSNLHGGLNCLVASGSSLYAGGGGVFFSTDNGASWNPTDSALSSEGIQTIAVVGSNLYVGTSYGVLKSTDNGVSWNKAGAGIPPVTPVYAFAASGSNIYAATGGAGIFVSTDNGANWTATDSGLTTQYIFSLAASGSKIIAGSHDGLFVSTDGGKIWASSDSGITEPIISSLVTSGSTTVAGAYPGVFISVDGGLIWTAADSIPAPAHAIDAFAVLDSDIFAGSYADGVFRSTDFGASWTPMNGGLGSNTYISGLAISGKTLFAIANGAVCQRPLSEMISAIETSHERIPSSFALKQNYPNPFNPSTIIDYQLPRQAHVMLRVYDVLGREVKTLVDETQSAGLHSATFNASSLSSGVYFYRLRAGTFSETRKLTVLK